MKPAETVFNESSIDLDFRVESNGNANMLFVDGGNDRVGIGTATPATMLHVHNASGNASAQLTSGTSGTSFINMGDTGDADAGQISYINNGDAMAFTAGAAERMRISSTGAALHSVAAQGSAFVPNTPATWNALEIFQDRGVTNSASGIAFRSQSGTKPAGIASVAGNTTGGVEGLSFMTVAGNVTKESMRLDTSGNLLVGRTSAGATGNGHSIRGGDSAVFSRDSSGETMVVCRNDSTGDLIRFKRNNTICGEIVNSGSTTVAYNTASDYRLKTDAQPMTGASDRVLALKPVNFEWIADGKRVDGFLAHEAQAVVPEAVTGTKDAMQDEEYQVSAATGDIYTPAAEAYVDADGNDVDAVDEVIHSTNAEQPETLEDGQQWRETTPAVMGTRSVPDMQGIDQSKMVPLLVASLQNALSRITALENA